MKDHIFVLYDEDLVMTKRVCVYLPPSGVQICLYFVNPPQVPFVKPFRTRKKYFV